MHIPQNPDFDAWRKRRIAAVRNELGFFGHMLDHPILAFELGDGCSVGCWFCAFSTRKLNKNFDFHQNRELFNGIAKECVDLFGSEAAAATLLYYGTEPHDNPNYLDFVKDFAAVTGHAVCTSTAVPTDAPWLRELIAFYRKDGLPWPRLSVLSRKMMYDIHDLYTPDELRDVELLMQMKESQHDKVKGGRLLEKVEGLRAVENGDYLGATVPQGSIACVSGFLINMVHGTIQLVSPCYTGEKWPCGYRVFGHDRFEGVDGFRAAMDRLIGRYMKNDPRSLKRIRFRDDLRYTKTDGGFTLVSPNQAHTFDGLALYGPLGELAAGGDLDYDGLLDGLMNGGADPFTAGAAVKSLYDHGFLDEVDMY